ncbi:MAG: CCA tRNA nucleotidyltransferase [Dehalococcoidia bacterium]|nr:CCA tRNA nucleotidyltransferase [Dehalococcoidia bacterium]
MQNINLSHKIQKYIPAEVLDIICATARLAQKHGQNLYLAGGAVRDILLEYQATDIDLVLEGDAIAIAQQLAAETSNNIILHTEFLTAKLQLPSFNLDLASARRESYPHPGSLPIVHPADISTDLRRRDFSINAMAISLNEESYGQLLDECDGLTDIHNQLIRVLHTQSFRDDATRMWRAVRYEQRLGFQIESTTKVLLQQSLHMLNSISGERLWYELECIFGEKLPEKTLSRAGELGLLHYIHPQIDSHNLLGTWYDQARQMSLPQKPEIGLYLALLLYRLEAEECEKVAKLLKLNKNLSRTLRDSAKIKGSAALLDDITLPPSFIYHTLCSYDATAIKASLIASTAENVRRHIQLYLEQLRYVKPILSGKDLISLGIKPGPNINALLNHLLDARLDGKTSSREDEIRLLELLNWLV